MNETGHRWHITTLRVIPSHTRSPFSHDSTLHNIATGMTANNNVNVDIAKSIGNSILESMTGHSPQVNTFRKSNIAVTQGTKSTINVDGDIMNADPL